MCGRGSGTASLGQDAGSGGAGGRWHVLMRLGGIMLWAWAPGGWGKGAGSFVLAAWS